MTITFVAWFLAALLLVFVGGMLGTWIGRGKTGILIDDRGRYSLTQFQVVLWTIVVLSLVAGVAVGRLWLGLGTALSFSIPPEVLQVIGISLGSAAAAVAVKASKDAAPSSQRIAASNEEDKPRFSQIFLVEEGELADKVVDITKFQNFWLTLLLVAAYVVLATNAIRACASVAELTALPGFSGTFATLLGISHAAYLAGKLPNRQGTPQGLTVALRHAGAGAVAATATAGTATTYVARNP